MIDYFKNLQINHKDNVVSIDSERFYREAEDYFFYFDRSDIAIKKLLLALSISPDNYKCLKFLGDIYFSCGKMDKSFDCFSRAAALCPCDVNILSSMAVVCEVLNKYQTSLDFINLAFHYYSAKDSKIYAQICDLKISLLIKMKKYKDAKIFLKQIKNRLSYNNSDFAIATFNSDILKKKLSLKERMEKLNIKVVV